MTEAERIRRMHFDKLANGAGSAKVAQEMLGRAVDDARQARMTWTAIGEAVGISKQGARQRWGL